jgi:hypothetical protein
LTNQEVFLISEAVLTGEVWNEKHQGFPGTETANKIAKSYVAKVTSPSEGALSEMSANFTSAATVQHQQQLPHPSVNSRHYFGETTT